jgi:hypothetical protein
MKRAPEKINFHQARVFTKRTKEVHIMRALSPVAATLPGDDPTRGDDPIDAFAWARRTLQCSRSTAGRQVVDNAPFRIPDRPRAGHQPFHNFIVSADGPGI